MNSYRLNNFILISSKICFIYSLGTVTHHNFPLVFFLPLSLLLITIVFYNTYTNLSNSIVFKIFLIQVVFRYILTAFLVSSGQTFSIGSNSEYLNYAILVMILELLSAFIVLHIFSKKQKKSYNFKRKEIIPLKNLPILTVILIAMFGYIYTTGSFNKINTLWGLTDYIEKYVTGNEDLETSSLGLVLFTPFKILLSLLAISFIYKTKKIKNKTKVWLYLITISLASIFIVGQSRFSMVLFVLPLLVLIGFMTSNRDYKKIFTFTAVFIIIALSISTASKFTRYGNTMNTNSIITAGSLNSYFAGPGNIAIGFEAYEKKKLYESPLYLLNDTFQNIPLLSKLTNNEYKLTLKFNEEIYSHRLYADQIVPLSVSSLFHFGFLGVFFYSSFFFQ